jgi:hypothetical protein
MGLIGHLPDDEGDNSALNAIPKEMTLDDDDDDDDDEDDGESKNLNKEAARSKGGKSRGERGWRGTDGLQQKMRWSLADLSCGGS